MSLPTQKNMLILSAISIVALIAVGWNYRISLDLVESTIFRQQEEAAEKSATIVDIWMNQQKKILTATVNSLRLDDIAENSHTYLPLHMAMKAGHFSDVYVGNEEFGTLVDGAGWEPPPWYDPRWRPWYKHAVAQGEMSFTTPYIDLVTYSLVIALVQPLEMNGQLVGVIGADTVLDTLENNIFKQRATPNSFSFIVEDQGTILIHKNRDYVMKENIFNTEKALQQELLQFEGDEAQSVRFISYDGLDSILSFKKISDSNWFLCVISPYEEAKELARKNTKLFTIELALKALMILALLVLSSLATGGFMLWMINKRYSSSLKEHKQEITGITRDLKWNINKRREVEAYYKTLYDIANDGIVISKELMISECNRKTEQIFRMSREELLGKRFLDLSPKYQPNGSLSADLLEEIYATTRQGESQVFRYTFLRKDGTEFPASVSIKSFKLKNQELLLTSIRDISKRVDAEAQLMQAHKMAAVGEMLGVIAHQWRQPLNTLSTYISSLQAAQLAGSLNRSFVEKIVAGADGQIKFMSKTIDDFRNFFRPSKIKERFNLLEVVVTAVKLMEAQIKSGDIQLTVHNKTESSSLMVFGYKSEFVHVLVNLVANARDALMEKASSDQSFKKRLDIRISSDQEHVVIDILDNGPGIPEHIMPLIFNPYYTTKSSKSGTGVGLYMAKMIVEKEMNGQLSAQNLDGFTKFSIQLTRIPENPEQ